MRVKWVRDEVILALDVYFKTEGKGLSMDNPLIIELSETLNKLPLVPLNKRSSTFRNVAGVSRQLNTFHYGLKNKKDVRIGNNFFEIYEEFKEKKERLHSIAQAIKQCIGYTENVCFAGTEMNIFQEGELLTHLHKCFERRANNKHKELKCYVCGVIPNQIYSCRKSSMVLENHLLIPPENYVPDLQISKEDIIRVCANCHNILHLERPWLKLNDARKILVNYCEGF